MNENKDHTLKIFNQKQLFEPNEKYLSGGETISHLIVAVALPTVSAEKCSFVITAIMAREDRIWLVTPS